MRIISIGDLVTDFYYKNGKLVGVNGGMTSHNIIANIAKLSLETGVYGVCGNDTAGNIAIKSLRDIGVNVDNIRIIDNLSTRCFHVSYFEENGKLEFKSKKRCPVCNEKNWYDESKIDTNDILEKISGDAYILWNKTRNANEFKSDFEDYEQ